MAIRYCARCNGICTGQWSVKAPGRPIRFYCTRFCFAFDFWILVKELKERDD
jgi:hypothetical protein